MVDLKTNVVKELLQLGSARPNLNSGDVEVGPLGFTYF